MQPHGEPNSRLMSSLLRSLSASTGSGVVLCCDRYAGSGLTMTQEARRADRRAHRHASSASQPRRPTAWTGIVNPALFQRRVVPSGKQSPQSRSNRAPLTDSTSRRFVLGSSLRRANPYGYPPTSAERTQRRDWACVLPRRRADELHHGLGQFGALVFLQEMAPARDRHVVLVAGARNVRAQDRFGSTGDGVGVGEC